MSVRTLPECPSASALVDRALQLYPCLVLALDGVLEDGDANLATYASIGLWRVAHDVMDLLEALNTKMGNRAARSRADAVGREFTTAAAGERPCAAAVFEIRREECRRGVRETRPCFYQETCCARRQRPLLLSGKISQGCGTLNCRCVAAGATLPWATADGAAADEANAAAAATQMLIERFSIT